MTFFFRFLLGKRKLKNGRRPFFRKRRQLLESSEYPYPHTLQADQPPVEEHDDVVSTHAEKREHEDPCLLLQLPTSILADIFSRLSFEAVCISGCVCKALRSLIRSPDFNSLRLERVDAEVFLRPDSVTCSSRALHMIDLHGVSSSSAIPSGSELHVGATMDVKVRFFLPKLGRLDPSPKVRKPGIWLVAQHSYDIVNSCNGLICLRKASMCTNCKSPCIVCNPFTGEFTVIPKPQKTETTKTWAVVSGFGCCARNNVYKVVRLVYGASALNPFDRIAEVHNLGSDSWRTIGPAPWDTVLEGSATFLNGAIHWLSEVDPDCKSSILCFHFGEEKFLRLHLPSHFLENMVDDPRKSKLTLGVLRRRLCASGFDLISNFHIWVMRDYGDHESWTKEFSFHFTSVTICRPIKWLENEDLMMLSDYRDLMIYNPLSKAFLKFNVLGTKSIVFQAIVHAPNFGSLSDFTGADNLVVHNYQSRWNVPGDSEEDAEAISLILKKRATSWTGISTYAFDI